VRDLIFSCSEFPFLDADKPLRKYQELVVTAPFVLMAESRKSLAAPPSLVAPLVFVAEQQHEFAPSPSLVLLLKESEDKYDIETPRQEQGEEIRREEEPREVEAREEAVPREERLIEESVVLVAPPSLVTTPAAALLAVQVAFPANTHLPMQSFRLSGNMSVSEAMEQIRRECGSSSLNERSSLCVDPMAKHVGAFANAPTFPYLESSVPLGFYRDVVTRNVLYWRNSAIHDSVAVAESHPASTADAHSNEYLLKGF
jgi:hypothetical protein